MSRRSRLLALGLALLAIGSILFASLPKPVAHAQGTGQTSELKPEVYGAVGFGITPDIRDLKAPVVQRDTGAIEGEDEELNLLKPLNPVLPKTEGKEPANSIDPLLKSLKESSVQDIISAPLPPPMVSFDGNSSADNAAAFGGRVLPPDTNGDVGPTQYVQTTNLLFRVFTKTGAPLTPPTKISTLFSAAGVTGVCATNDNGDPIVLYDQLADRWLISQFAFASSSAPPYHQCIAISKTGDAAGQYFAYDFITPGNNFNDYPHFGVWPDAYYMSDNQFLNGGSFNGAGAFAYDRAKMLRGDSTATFIYFNQPSPRGGQLPTDMDGLRPPPPGTPNYFCEYLADEFTDPLGNIDGILIFEFRANFANPAASTFTLQQPVLPVAAFDPRQPNSRNVAEQPPPATAANSLDVIQDRLLYRIQYRNFGTRDSLVLNHTVNVSGVTPTTQATHQAGVRYYDLRRNTPGTGNFGVGEQGTFSPDAGNPVTGVNRWMGSAAQDNQGNLAIGFSSSSTLPVVPPVTGGTSGFPSVRYAGRLFGDPPNGIPANSETSLVEGSGVQRSTSGRWGDYSMLGVDPRNDCDFWFTTEYYTAASQLTSTAGWLTRIGSFKFPTCTAPQQGTLTVNVTDCVTGAAIPGAVVTINGNVYGATVADGTFSTVLPPGTYTVTISVPDAGFSSPVTRTVTITDGGTTNVSVCLNSGPALIASTGGVTLVNESCPPANGGIDPGERVSVNLSVRNSSLSASTVNLVATLQPSANVVAPSSQQNYGALAPNASATRTFSFTANGNCGDTITLTLQLQDGANNLGTVTYTTTLGALVTTPTFSENFDSVVPPLLPPGFTTDTAGIGIPWTTSNVNPDTAPNDAFGPETSNVGITNLNSPVIAIPSGGTSQLTFRNLYNLENGFDGEVLEIRIGAGAFQDILAAGGSFASGGYNGTISNEPANQSPIQGRAAWTGLSSGTTAAPAYITSIVNLPAAAAGQSIQLRWRVGSDNLFTAAGQPGVRIDTINLSFSSRVCNSSCSQARVVTTTTLARSGSNVVATVTVQNQGITTATNVTINSATLGATSGTPVPQNLGDLAAGQSASTTITFANPGAAGTRQVLRINGTFDGTTPFGKSQTVTLP